MTREEMVVIVEDQIEVLGEALKVVPPDSEEYETMQHELDRYITIHEELTTKKKRIRWERFRDCLDLGIRVAGTICIPLFLGVLAYSSDRELKLINQRDWNLIGKRFDK